MNSLQKAQEIFDKTVAETPGILKNFLSLEDVAAIVKKIAVSKVDEIIDALKTTTGHLTLNKLDQHEIRSDFKFWDEVRNYIIKVQLK